MFQRAVETLTGHSEQRFPPLWFDFYLLFISSLASPIFQKQLAVGYEKCDSF